MHHYLYNFLKNQKDKRINQNEMIKQKCGLTVGGSTHLESLAVTLSSRAVILTKDKELQK